MFKKLIIKKLYNYTCIFIKNTYIIKNKFIIYYKFMNNRNSFSSRRNNNSSSNRIKKTLKDYLIPLVWAWIILIIILSFIFWWKNDEKVNTKSTNTTNTSTWSIKVSLDDLETEAFIRSDAYERKSISWETRLWANDTLIVKNWSVSVESPDINLRLNKMWELEINEKWWLKLISSDLWGIAKKTFAMDMMYANIKLSSWTVFSLAQNEAISTIYVISGSAEVSNLAWSKTLLGNWQKVLIQNKDASNKNLDLTLSKDNIDTFFTNSDWYTKNKVDLMWEFTWSTSSTWSTWSLASTWAKVSTGRIWDSIIELDDLRDEMVVSTNKINVNGRYYSDFVSSIKLDWVKAKLNLENKTFSFWQITLTKKENDLVIKALDSEDNIISKDVVTVYYNWVLPKEEAPKATETQSSASSQTTVIDSSKFVFTAPWASPYTTKESMVTIRWTVPKWLVEKIVVNWFTLQRFTKFWTDWRYHADVNNMNFKEWTNVYEVKYYGEAWKLLYTNSFTIIKKSDDPVVTTDDE